MTEETLWNTLEKAIWGGNRDSGREEGQNLVGSKITDRVKWETSMWTDDPRLERSGGGRDRGRGGGWGWRVGASGRIHQEPGDQNADRVGGMGLAAVK